MKEHTLPRLCRMSFLLVAAAIILATVQDYGISWDEPAQVTYGNLIISYFRSHGTDLRANAFANLRFYGPGIEPLSAWLAQGHPAQVYLIRHLVSAAAMLMTFPALFIFGELASEEWIGITAAAVLALMPMFWGHGFVNSKDIPVAMAFSWFMVALVRVVRTGSGFLLLGVAMGITLECRPGMLPLLVAFSLIGCLLAWRAHRGPYSGTGLVGVGAKACCAFATGWVLMIALWPWAHEEVFWHPLVAIWHALHFSESYPVLFAGKLYDSRALPPFYLIWHLIIGMPLIDVVLFIVGCIYFVWLQRRRKLPSEAIVVLAWVVIPIGLWTLNRSNIYDGMRHFLFVLPGAALVIAWGLCGIFRLLAPRISRPWAVGVVVVLVAAPLPCALRLHPYEMTFFNSLIGGMAHATGQFETDYWLISYKEAMEWINAQAENQQRSVHVLVAANDRAVPCAAFFRSERVHVKTLFERVEEDELPPEYDYYVATTRYGFDKNFPATPIVHQIGRLGACFTVVKGKARIP